MEKEILARTNKIKSNKVYIPLFDLSFKYLFIILFLTLFSISQEQNEIYLKVRGPGTRTFIKAQFSAHVYINGEDKGAQHEWNFDLDLNNVTMKFENQVENCQYMFIDLVDILEIDLSNFNTIKLNNMRAMFDGCTNLQKITFGNINTALVTNMYRLFYNCESLLSIDLSKFNTSLVTDMNEIFTLCKSIKSLDVSKFNTSKVEGMYDMFAYCYNLTSIDFHILTLQKLRICKECFMTSMH